MVRRVTEVMKQVTPNYEIVYVNDGSPDDSLSILRELAEKDQRITVIIHSRNFNSQMALTSGLRYCTGNAAILMDGDLQDPPELIPSFVEQWLQGNDVVYGVRKSREEGICTHVCRRLFYALFQKLSYISIPANAGDFSLLDRKVITVLNQMPERDRFIRGLRAWVGFRQIGVPYHRAARFDGKKATSSWSGYIRYAKSGLLSFSRVPLELLFYAGILFTGLASFGIAYYLAMWLFLPPSASPPGLITLYLLILFFGGVQLLSISIVGEYVGKVFDEVKQRPLFVVKEIINDYRNSSHIHDVLAQPEIPETHSQNTKKHHV